MIGSWHYDESANTFLEKTRSLMTHFVSACLCLYFFELGYRCWHCGATIELGPTITLAKTLVNLLGTQYYDVSMQGLALDLGHLPNTYLPLSEANFTKRSDSLMHILDLLIQTAALSSV